VGFAVTTGAALGDKEGLSVGTPVVGLAVGLLLGELVGSLGAVVG